MSSAPQNDAEVISYKVVTARRDHKCVLCDHTIKANDRYQKSTVKVDGKLVIVRNHLVCLT